MNNEEETGKLLNEMRDLASDGAVMGACGVRSFKPGVSDRMLFLRILEREGGLSKGVSCETAVNMVAALYQRFYISFYEV